MQTVTSFDQLGLGAPILQALGDIGYETPSPIQAETIPLILAQRDVLGEAQTGTGKTAAFALPILSTLDLSQRHVQVLVLAPTRELAIQVSEAFQKYAKYLDGFHVLPIYGGQDYRGQIRALERGVHIVVGTPGRVMDHMRRGTLKLDQLSTLVLDEADEMLRMGFIDDVEWILKQTPAQRQIALFSATMPPRIRKIASAHLNDPAQITIKVKTTTAETIRQRYWSVSGLHKLDALTRILEVEPFDAMIIFVRTKTSTLELAEKLEARGFATAALNGDIQQNQRERTVNALKAGKIDIIVATDVAARGLDVPRISHVVNYDVPYDTEAYVHRIGRTGRAGRAGDAILFVAPREKRMLAQIERATRKQIERMELPSTEVINDKRISNFKQRITDTLADENLGFYSTLLEQYQSEHNVPGIEIAAALAKLLQGDSPLLVEQAKHSKDKRGKDKRGNHTYRDEALSDRRNDRPRSPREPRKRKVEAGMKTYRLEVGHQHKVKPGNIVGAISGETGLDSKYIGRIDIYDDHSLVDLPEGMPKELFKLLRKAYVSGQQLNISDAGIGAGKAPDKRARTPKSAKPEKVRSGKTPKKKATRTPENPKKSPGQKKNRFRDRKNIGKQRN